MIGTSVMKELNVLLIIFNCLSHSVNRIIKNRISETQEAKRSIMELLFARP